jgi:hypothetical protein
VSAPAGYVRRMNLGPLMLLIFAMLFFQPWLAMRGMFPASARTALDVATVVAVALLLAVRRPRLTLDAIHPSVRPWFVWHWWRGSRPESRG